MRIVSHFGHSRKRYTSPLRGATTRFRVRQIFNHILTLERHNSTIIAHIPLLSAVSVISFTSSTILLDDSHSLHTFYSNIFRKLILWFTIFSQPASERSIRRHFVPFTANDDVRRKRWRTTFTPFVELYRWRHQFQSSLFDKTAN